MLVHRDGHDVRNLPRHRKRPTQIAQMAWLGKQRENFKECGAKTKRTQKKAGGFGGGVVQHSPTPSLGIHEFHGAAPDQNKGGEGKWGTRVKRQPNVKKKDLGKGVGTNE